MCVEEPCKVLFPKSIALTFSIFYHRSSSSSLRLGHFEQVVGAGGALVPGQRTAG